MIKNDEHIYLKFPCVLRAKLETEGFDFSKETEFEYEPIRAYRCIEREKNDNTQIDRNDFLSNIEELIYKGKKIKKNVGKQRSQKMILIIMAHRYLKREKKLNF